MKLKVSLLFALAAFTSPALAGPPPAPVVAPVQSFGLGWYGAIDGGVNVYQSYRDDRTFTLNAPNGGGNGGGGITTISVTRENKVGGFGGMKLGYVFGAGTVRFALEEDVFYNGFQSSLRATANTGQAANFETRVNSVAFMTNFIVRFAPGNGRFQPYLGAGIGGYYASVGDSSVNVNNMQTSFPNSASGGGFAWQFLGGADYYINRRNSIFLEYKYLNYNHVSGVGNIQFNGQNPNNIFGSTNLGQSLIGAGWRFHF